MSIKKVFKETVLVMNEHRLFVAITIPQNIKDEIIKEREKLQIPMKLTPPENLHLTAHFMGNIPDKDLSSVAEKLTEVTKAIAPFRIEVSEIIYKNNKGRHMLWVAFNPSVPYEELCIDIAKSLNVKLTKKPLAHITIVRSKNKIPGNFPVSLKALPLEVSSIELWESNLSSQGAKYTSLFTFKLKG